MNTIYSVYGKYHKKEQPVTFSFEEAKKDVESLFSCIRELEKNMEMKLEMIRMYQDVFYRYSVILDQFDILLAHSIEISSEEQNDITRTTVRTTRDLITILQKVIQQLDQSE